MDDPGLLFRQLLELYNRLGDYERLIAARQYDEAESLRLDLAVLWGEVQEDVVELGVPIGWSGSGRVFPTFETALSRFVPLTGSVFIESIGHARTSLRMALGKLRRMIRQRTSSETTQSTRTQVEQEHSYASHPAQVAQTPFLSERDISDAYRMSELYIILHCYENSVRCLIEKVLSHELGEDWWEKAASAKMKSFVDSRRQAEQRKKWLSPRGQTPLYYLEWGDLVKLIRKYEKLFLPQIDSLRFVENRFEELETLRNIVAHNGVLSSDDDFQRVMISFRDWCRQVGS